MPGGELLQVVPLAIFESDNVPEIYNVEPTGSFVVDNACALGDEFTVLPLYGRFVQDGIQFNVTDELNAATMGSVGVGWIGHVEAKGRKLYAEVAEEITVTSIVPYCSDISQPHNNSSENLLKHILKGKHAQNTLSARSHKWPLDRGIAYRDSRLLPHCGDPMPEELTVAYNFRTEGPRVIFSI